MKRKMYFAWGSALIVLVFVMGFASPNTTPAAPHNFSGSSADSTVDASTDASTDVSVEAEPSEVEPSEEVSEESSEESSEALSSEEISEESPSEESSEEPSETPVEPSEESSETPVVPDDSSEAPSEVEPSEPSEEISEESSEENSVHVHMGTPSCTAPAFCALCGEEHGAPLGHDFISLGDAVEATCTSSGYTGTVQCTRCGTSLMGEHQAALGHDYRKVGEVPATSSAPGYSGDTVCSHCGCISETGVETPKLPVFGGVALTGREAATLARVLYAETGVAYSVSPAAYQAQIDGLAYAAPEQPLPPEALFISWETIEMEETLEEGSTIQLYILLA